MAQPLRVSQPPAVEPEEARAGELFPAFLKLVGRRVVLVGGGRVAVSKLAALSSAGADVTVVAPDVRPEMAASGLRILLRPFQPSDLDGAWLAVAAATPEVNQRVAAAAEARRIFVNAVDDQEAASAYAGGVFRRGGVTVAISTEGRAPALAGLLREALEVLIPADVAAWLERAASIRASWRREGVPIEGRRPLLLRVLNEIYAERARASDRPGERSAG